MGCQASRVVPDDIEAGRGSSAPRLVLYSEHAAEMPNFEEALSLCGTKLQRYDFATTSCEDFLAMISKLVASHGHFARIAVAPHGVG